MGSTYNAGIDMGSTYNAGIDMGSTSNAGNDMVSTSNAGLHFCASLLRRLCGHDGHRRWHSSWFCCGNAWLCGCQ